LIKEQIELPSAPTTITASINSDKRYWSDYPFNCISGTRISKSFYFQTRGTFSTY